MLDINGQQRQYRTSAQPPKFQWSHLWQQPIINPVNLKSYTLPILTLKQSIFPGRFT